MSEEFEQLDIEEQLNNDFEFFVNFVHKKLENSEWEWNGYNRKIKTELMNIHKLKYKLLIINIPPRLGKTLLMIYLDAWSMYRDSRVYNNYYSYSDLLVNRKYTIIQKIFKIPEIMEGAKATYKREKEDFSNSQGGGTFAQTTFGQVTGVGCARKEPIDEFTGILCIDDPHKAQDSIIKMISANKAIKSAILNRRNNHRVPMVLIMQRLSKFDATAFLKEHFSDWFITGEAKHLVIPAELNGKSISSREYPLDQLALEKKKDPDYYWTQLMQQPQNIEGTYFKNKHFDIVENVSNSKSYITVSFNHENTSEPIVFLAFKKDGKDIVILDYQEESVEAGRFFDSLKDFAEVNGAKKVYIPKGLISKGLKQEMKPLKVEEVEESANIGLSAYYSIDLLKSGKIKLKNNDTNKAFREELKLYPNSKRDYVVKAMINIIEVIFIKGAGRIASSL